jgi:hypothetical protein
LCINSLMRTLYFFSLILFFIQIPGFTEAGVRKIKVQNSKLSPNCQNFLGKLKDCIPSTCQNTRDENSISKELNFTVLKKTKSGKCEIQMKTEKAIWSCEMNGIQKNTLHGILTEFFRKPSYDYQIWGCVTPTEGCFVQINQKKFLDVMKIAVNHKQCSVTTK